MPNATFATMSAIATIKNGAKNDFATFCKDENMIIEATNAATNNSQLSSRPDRIPSMIIASPQQLSFWH
jgi:hypothetical protein